MICPLKTKLCVGYDLPSVLWRCHHWWDSLLFIFYHILSHLPFSFLLFFSFTFLWPDIRVMFFFVFPWNLHWILSQEPLCQFWNHFGYSPLNIDSLLFSSFKSLSLVGILKLCLAYIKIFFLYASLGLTFLCGYHKVYAATYRVFLSVNTIFMKRFLIY